MKRLILIFFIFLGLVPQADAYYLCRELSVSEKVATYDEVFIGKVIEIHRTSFESPSSPIRHADIVEVKMETVQSIKGKAGNQYIVMVDYSAARGIPIWGEAEDGYYAFQEGEKYLNYGTYTKGVEGISLPDGYLLVGWCAVPTHIEKEMEGMSFKAIENLLAQRRAQEIAQREAVEIAYTPVVYEATPWFEDYSGDILVIVLLLLCASAYVYLTRKKIWSAPVRIVAMLVILTALYFGVRYLYDTSYIQFTYLDSYLF
jgi:hypothetical protein